MSYASRCFLSLHLVDQLHSHALRQLVQNCYLRHYCCLPCDCFTVESQCKQRQTTAGKLNYVVIDCCGQQDGFQVTTTSGQKFDNVDLSEGEWVEYDEKLGESVGIMELEHKLSVHK